MSSKSNYLFNGRFYKPSMILINDYVAITAVSIIIYDQMMFIKQSTILIYDNTIIYITIVECFIRFTTELWERKAR